MIDREWLEPLFFVIFRQNFGCCHKLTKAYFRFVKNSQ